MRDWLKALPDADRQVIGFDLGRVPWHRPVGMPLCRPLGGGPTEPRSSLPGNRIARLMFFVEDDEIYLVHGFVKKTQATPDQAIALARRRLKETKE